MLLCVDRENVKNEFKDVFSNFIGEQKNIMYLTGIPGIGKSVLIEYLHRNTEEYFNNVLNVFINFNTDGTYFSFFHNAYIQLREYGVKFYMYELACRHLFQLIGDEKFNIEKENNDFAFRIAELPFEFIRDPLTKVIATGGLEALKKIFVDINEKYHEYLLQKCKEITDTKHEDIIKNLGKYFISDVNMYCKTNKKNICYFIDTFEKCKEKTDFSEEDFIENFIIPSTYSFWIIGGTSKNVLIKYKNKFDYFSYISIDNFDQKKYVEEILNKQYGETDKSVADNIFKLSKGYPAAVELIAQTYKELKKESSEFLFSDLNDITDLADFYKKFFYKYYNRHVIKDDLHSLAFLSCFDSWTYKEYEYYNSANFIGNPIINFEKLKKYVIVKENTDGSFFIIDVAKNCLLNADKLASVGIYRQAFDYLRKEINRKSEEQINEKDSEKLHSQTILAIKLGAKILTYEESFAKEYYDWFIKFEQSLSPKMLYELKATTISCFVSETQAFLKNTKKDNIHSNCLLQCFYDYAWTFCYQRNYARAWEIVDKYEMLAKKIICNNIDERIIKAQYTKAVILENLGEYDKSLLIHKEILEIRKKGTDKRVIGVSLNCIGFLYMLMTDFPNAKRYFEESLIYRSPKNDLRGFCTVHSNLSKMYFLQSLHTNNTMYLNKAKEELDIALEHMDKENMSALYRSWKIRYVILEAQMLRCAKETSKKCYANILLELNSFIDMIKTNPQFGMANHVLTTKNNMAIIFAIIGDNDKAIEIISECLIEKELFYDIKTNPKNKPCNISRKNLDAIKEHRLHDLVFEY
ncbi:MAG: tetratricopeptide repeat protein [Clostridia bacterium]|nr:tetratricopeptide repeat protein [Clostridia bacterium]